MPPIFYDTHAHLDYPDFQEELPLLIERAAAAGIARIITIGTDLVSSARSIKLAEQFPAVHAVIGWHPTTVLQAPYDIRPDLRKLARHSKVVAIGETGLDYHHLPSEKPEAAPEDDTIYKQRQAALFRQHLEVAGEFGLNCVIHQRDAFADTLEQMQPFAGRVRGVFHCFVDDPAAMRRVLAIGSLVSFTGIVTFKNARTVRETLEAAPMGQFMLETDSPYLAPVPYRGKRCEPAYVREISECAASVKKCSIEDLSAATCATAQKFFHRMT